MYRYPERRANAADIRRECIAFGRELLRTNDLDPLYVMLYCAQLDRKTLGRFILAYSMFYHAGVAAKLATVNDFWLGVSEGIRLKWPRGTERRHWRGKIATGTLISMKQMSPELVLDDWANPTFRQVFNRVQIYSGYGPWIAFKIADLFDRTGYQRVDFANADLSIYRDPKMGAALYQLGDKDAAIDKGQLKWALDEIAETLNAEGFRAPPLYDRPLNVQEAETILCKFKSHYNGHYPMGKDTREILHGLGGWGDLAEQLGKAVLL